VAKELGRARFIDVREPHEYTGELGHIAGSELVPMAQVEQASRDWPKDQRIVLVCRSGARSGRMAGYLVTAGFKHITNLTGGMIAWGAAGLPVER
jgi:rhodanese-related sulfurtransferase